MNKKYTTAKGIRIAYLEKNPEAKNTIFFIHGNSLSANYWTKQFQSELLVSYRLVAFDLPHMVILMHLRIRKEIILSPALHQF